jgi:seryl-tRNA synthetase
MLDINFIRENPDTIKKGIAKKGVDGKIVDEFLDLDAKWRDLVKKTEDLRAKQKRAGEDKKIEEAKSLKEEIKLIEGDLAEIEKRRQESLFGIPNLPLDVVPEGKSEKENISIKEVGKKPEFGFSPKDHLEIGETLGIIDFESGAKVAGSGFYYLKNEGVLLELALVRYALDFLRNKGFDLCLTPDIAKEKFYLGTGYNPKGSEAQTFKIENSDLGLIATAEITLAGIHADETLKEIETPKFYAGYSHCFRQEAGSYGKYSKGLYRVHQFTKVEMFVYSRPEDSPAIHEKLLGLEEEIWQGLGIPYRVLEMCAGDLGAQAARKFDLEAWMPGRGDWGEITSTSNTTDYQARRLGIKIKKENGETEFAHTLNGTAIATSRAIVAILENRQREDGSVEMPEALREYLGFKEIRK